MRIRFMLGNPAATSRIDILYDGAETYRIENRGKNYVRREMRNASKVLRYIGGSWRCENGIRFRVYDYESSEVNT